MRVARLHSITPIRNFLEFQGHFLEFQDFLDGSCLDDLWSSSEKSNPTPLCDPVRLCPQSFSAFAIKISRYSSHFPVLFLPPTSLDLIFVIVRFLQIWEVQTITEKMNASISTYWDIGYLHMIS